MRPPSFMPAVHRSQNEPAKAAACFAAAAEREPANLRAFLNAANQFAAVSDDRGRETVIRSLYAHHPRDPKAALNFARLLFAKNTPSDERAALTCVQAAIALPTMTVHTRRQFIELLAKYGQSDKFALRLPREFRDFGSRTHGHASHPKAAPRLPDDLKPSRLSPRRQPDPKTPRNAGRSDDREVMARAADALERLDLKTFEKIVRPATHSDAWRVLNARYALIEGNPAQAFETICPLIEGPETRITSSGLAIYALTAPRGRQARIDQLLRNDPGLVVTEMERLRNAARSLGVEIEQHVVIPQNGTRSPSAERHSGEPARHRVAERTPTNWFVKSP